MLFCCMHLNFIIMLYVHILYISFLNYSGGCHQVGGEKEAFHSENGMETLMNWYLWFHQI